MTVKQYRHNDKGRIDRQFVVLTKLANIGPMNMLEIGFSATPDAIRKMAARGLIRVEVTATDRGREWLNAEKINRAQRKREMLQAKRMFG